MIKRFLKLILLFFLWVVCGFFKLFKRQNGNELAVLMYHSISDTDWQFSVSPKSFEDQLQFLKKNNYNFLTPRRLLDVISGNTLFPKKGILITFDDGYGDFTKNALPILRKYDVPAALFIHTTRSSEDVGSDLPLMSWDDIRYAKNQGIEIGNHSHGHSDLKTLGDNDLEKEIRMSEDIFRNEIGEVPKIFAYPGGKLNDNVIKILRKYRYEAGFTIDEGLVSNDDNPMRIRRVGVEKKTGMLEFKIKLTGAINWYNYLKRLVLNKK